MKMTTDALAKIAELDAMTKHVLYGAEALSVILVIYFLFSSKGGFKNKFIGFLAMIFGLVALVGFIIGGLYIGKVTGLGDMAALIGVVAFAVLFGFIGYLRTPKDKRKKSYF